MQSPRRFPAYIALAVSGSTFAGAAAASVNEPLVAVLLLAQVVAIAAVVWIVRDAKRDRLEVVALRAELTVVKDELAGFRTEMAHIDEHTELLASRTGRLANLLEVQKAIQPTGGTGEETGEVLRFPARPHVIR